jgi:hypothetical protein
MTSTEIRETLTEIAHAVEVPGVDEVAFRSRVRSEQRRRTAGRMLVAGVAAAAVVSATAMATLEFGEGSHDGSRVADSGPSEPGIRPAPQQPVAVALRGKLEVIGLTDGATFGSDVRVQEILAQTALGVVVVDDESRVLLVPVARDGQLGRPRSVIGDEPVQRARVAKNGLTIAWVDLEDGFHLRELGADTDTFTGELLSSGSLLLAVDGTRWVEELDDRLVVRDPKGTHEVVSDFPGMDAELAGQTLAVHTDDGAEFFESWDATPRLGSLGGSTGALSPEGGRYVAAPDQQQLDQGASRQLSLIDTFAGTTQALPGFGQGTVLDLVWENDDRVLVLTTSPTRPDTRVLWDCSTSRLECTQRFDDPSGTLEVLSQ